MVEVVRTRTWANRGIYVGLALLVIFGRLLPLDAGPGGWPSPDLILLLTYAWALRRPDAVSVPLVTLVILSTDILFMRPLGLWTACVILGLEFLRSREHLTRDLSFLGEWLMIGATILAITALNALVLTVFGAIRPPFGQLVLQTVATILTYPLVVLFSAAILGVRRMAPGAVDQLGRKV